MRSTSGTFSSHVVRSHGKPLRDNRTLAATVEEGTAPKRVTWKMREPNAIARSQVTWQWKVTATQDMNQTLWWISINAWLLAIWIMLVVISEKLETLIYK